MNTSLHTDVVCATHLIVRPSPLCVPSRSHPSPLCAFHHPTHPLTSVSSLSCCAFMLCILLASPRIHLITPVSSVRTSSRTAAMHVKPLMLFSVCLTAVCCCACRSPRRTRLAIRFHLLCAHLIKCLPRLCAPCLTLASFVYPLCSRLAARRRRGRYSACHAHGSPCHHCRPRNAKHTNGKITESDWTLERHKSQGQKVGTSATFN
jgi:hypothetical protein